MDYGKLSHTPPSAPVLSIGVLVLNYNTWELALRALHVALQMEGDRVAEYVLFDDGSSTPPPAEIDSRIRVIRGGINRGFANALREAFAAMQSDVVVLFDSDAYPLTRFSERVRERFSADAQLGQLGFVAQDEDGGLTESGFPEPTQWSLMLGQALYARVPRPAPRDSRLCVITGCMATRMQACRDIGGFDAKMDFLDVDVDYSMRLRKSGWRVQIDTSLRAFHVGGGTRQTQRNRVLHFYKSRWYLLRKHGLLRSPRLARAVILARLRCEQAILKLAGRVLFTSPTVLEDKVLGRRALIAYCSTNFR